MTRLSIHECVNWIITFMIVNSEHSQKWDIVSMPMCCVFYCHQSYSVVHNVNIGINCIKFSTFGFDIPQLKYNWSEWLRWTFVQALSRVCEAYEVDAFANNSDLSK